MVSPWGEIGVEGLGVCGSLRPAVIEGPDWGGVSMGKRSKTGVLKRLREVKKAEKAALKREEARERKDSGLEDEVSSGAGVATDEDLAGYGFPVAEEEEAENS